MKKIIYFFILVASTLATLVVFPQQPVQVVIAQSEAGPANSPQEVPAPAVDAAPGPLYPDTIEDEVLLQALEALGQRPDAIPLWDEKTITGQELADFVKNNAIPVVWGSEEICGGSCSLLYFSGGAYVYEDGQPGVDPIYINPAVKDQTVGRAARLQRELSHEIFHRMRPFGAVNVTQLEEFWAFSVETRLTQAAWPVFDGCDPFDPDSLEGWFTRHGLGGYLVLQAYPEG